MYEIYRDYDDVMVGKSKKINPKYFASSPEVNQKRALAIYRYAFDVYLGIHPDNLENVLDKKFLKMLNLAPLEQYITFPMEYAHEKIHYIILLLYHRETIGSLAARTRFFYHSVLTNKSRRFPDDYFLGDEGIDKALICLRYMIETQFGNADMEFLYKTFSSDGITSLLKKWRLYSVCGKIFGTPLDYLRMALIRNDESDRLYAKYSAGMKMEG